MKIKEVIETIKVLQALPTDVRRELIDQHNPYALRRIVSLSDPLAGVRDLQPDYGWLAEVVRKNRH